MKKYVTTPIYYVNAKPHLGHAYTTILADIIKRNYLQRGDDVVFLTGTDEHGEKIAKIAKQQNITPQQLVDEIAGEFKSVWSKMNLNFDIFYRTTQPSHHEAVKKALIQLKEQGEIVFREYEGNYCVGCERFLTETELTAEKLCPDHLTRPEPRKEGNYFFLMSKYQRRLIEFFEKNPNALRPEQYRSEILSFLKEPLTDLCISRPKERLSWGIEIPFDTKFVTYVWVDALMNYLAAAGWPDHFDKALWESVTHFIAKDIVKTHAVYWTAILMALKVPVFKELQVSGYWLMGGTKMSKSLGNVIRPLELEEKYGPETLRFFLLREMSYGQDSTFTLEGYVNCINAYLANGMGNLASRVLTLCQKNFKGSIEGKELLKEDVAILELRAKTVQEWDKAFKEIKYQNGLKAWSELVTATDLYINNTKPWALAKDPASSERLQVVLGVCLQMLQTIGVLIYPIMPQAAVKLCEALGIGKFDLKANFPKIELALENRLSFQLAPEVPRLFPRVSLPAEAE